MSAGLNSQVGLAFGRYAPCAQPNLRKPDEQRHGRVREPAPKVLSFQLPLTGGNPYHCSLLVARNSDTA